MSIRKRIYGLLEPSTSGSPSGRALELGLITLIFLNIAAIFLESVEEINREYGNLFRSFENFSVVIFSVEYVLRIWTAPKTQNTPGDRGGGVFR